MTTDLLPETEDATHTRQALQGKWWAKLVKHTDAILHQHIAPGKLVLFGASSEEAECLVAPGMSLQYWVWPDWCEVSLSIDFCIPDQSRSDTLSCDKETSAYERLLAHKDNIEASFGSVLEWRDSFVGFHLDGGYGSSDVDWDEIIASQVGAMNRLHDAVMPHIIIAEGAQLSTARSSGAHGW